MQLTIGEALDKLINNVETLSLKFGDLLGPDLMDEGREVAHELRALKNSIPDEDLTKELPD